MAETIKINFDPSSILNGINQIYEKLKTANGGKNQNFILNTETELKNAQLLVNQINQMITKGITTKDEAKQFDNLIKSFENSVGKVGSNLEKLNFSTLTNEAKEAKKIFEQQDKILKDVAAQQKQNIELQLTGVDNASKMAKEITNEAKEGKNLATIQADINAKLDEQIAKQKQIVQQKQANLNTATQEKNALSAMPANLRAQSFSTTDNKAVNNTQMELIRMAYSNSVTGASSAEDALKKFGKELDNVGLKFKNQDTITRNLTTSYQNFVAKSAEVAAANNKVKTATTELTNAEKDLTGLNNQQTVVTQLANNSKIVDSVTAITEKVKERTTAETAARLAQEKTENVQGTGLQGYLDTLKQQTTGLKQSIQATKDQIKIQDDLNRQFDMFKSRIQYVFTFANALRSLKSIVTSTFNDIKELDKSFASIAMVTDYSVQEMWASYDQYAQMANELGQSTKDVISSSALFYQQGLNTEEALELTTSTMKLATLAGIDFSEATSQMTAALRGFHMEMDQGEHITDVYSELAAKAAADVEGIAYAMSKTASIASSAGMSFETTSAFLTQMIETTQEAPENIGTAMKTIIARFTELKENVAGTADSEFDDLDYNKVDKALKTVGISIKDASGQFRNLDEVFLELSSKWAGLDRNTQRYIATIAAGSRQQSRFIAMMENYDRTVELVEVAQNSAGKSSEQFAKYQDTVEYKLKQIQNAWEQLRISFMGSDFLKEVLDLLINFVDTVKDMDPAQFVAVGAIGLTIGKQVIMQMISGIKAGGDSLTAAFNTVMKKATSGINSATAGIRSKISTSIFNAQNQNLITNMRNKMLELNLGTQTATTESANLLLQYAQIDTKLTEINAEITKIKTNEMGTERAVTELNTEETTRLNTLKQETLELERQKGLVTTSLGARGISSAQIGSLTNGVGSQIRGNANPITRSASTTQMLGGIGTGLQQGVSAAITTALITGISGADIGTVLKTALISGLMSAIPMVLSAVMPVIITFLSGPAGIVVIAVAAIAAIGVALNAYMDKQEELRNAELERLANVKKANEELQEQTAALITTYKKATEEEEKFNDAIKTVTETQNKSFLTSDEQAELDSAVDYLNSNYEGAIEEIENSNRFKVIEEKVTEIEENTRKSKQETIAETYRNTNTRANNLTGREEEAKEILSSIVISADSFIGPKDAIGYTSGVAAEPSQQALDMYGGDVQWAYATTSYAMGEIGDELKELNTIYGDSLNLDELFGVEGLEDALNRGASQSELGEIFDENGKTTIDILNTIADSLDADFKDIGTGVLGSAIGQINTEDSSAALRDDIKNNLILQDWDETAAEIASYSQEIQRKQVEALDEFQADDAKDFLTQIKKSNFTSVFGEGMSSSVEQAFETLGYGGENEKGMEDLFSSGTNLVKFSELSEEMQEALYASTDKKVQEAVKAWDSGKGFDDRKDAKKMQDAILQVLAEQMVTTDEFWAENNQEYFENNKDVITDLGTKLLDSSDQTWEDYSQDVDDIINSTDDTKAQEAMQAYLDQAEDSVYQLWQGYIDGLKEIGLDENILSKMDYASTSTLSTELSDMNLTDYAEKQITDYMNEAFSGLNGDTLNVLGQIDLSELSSISIDASQDYIEQLTAATGNAKEATELYNDYIKNVQAITRAGAFLGPDSTTVLKSNFQDFFSSYGDTYDSMQTATEEMFENQALSAETYYQLIEDGFEDYVTISSNGYTLIGDKAEEMWTSMALRPLTQLDGAIAQQRTLLDEANSMLDVFEEKEGFDTIIKQYFALSEEEKETSTLLDELTDKEKDFAQFIVGEGYSSIEKYVQALQEGKIALESMRSDEWIEGLVAMSSMASSAAEGVRDLNDKLKEAKKEQVENEKSLNDATEALRQAKEGTDNYRSGLDGLINYTNKIDRLNDTIETTKDRLEDVNSVEEASGLLGQLGTSVGTKKAALGAENMALEQGMADLRNVLTQNYGDFVSFDENGFLSLDFGYEELLKDNDAIKKNLEETVSKYSEYYSKEEENLKEQEELDKEFLEMREQYLEDFVSVQENLISVLKEKTEEEVDIQKEKYDALEEADNNYLDALEEAIEKQRKLREQENQYEDLAQKEKKLSLMQRDTSGANQKEVNELNEEVEQDRQDLLDNEVDNIIDSLREMYETQKEARDAELEYMEAVTENTQYFAEWAAEIMSTWNSVEDMQNWYLQNDPSTQDMTVEQTENYLNTIGEDYSKLATYRAAQTTDYIEKAEAATGAMNQIFETTSTNIADIGTAMLTIAEQTKNDAIEKAQETWDNAKEKFDETAEEIAQLELDLEDAEKSALLSHQATMDAMVEASTSGLLDVSTYAISQIAMLEGIDWTDDEAVKTWATERGYINSDNIGKATFNNAYEQQTGEESPYLSKGYTVYWGGGGTLNNSQSFDTEEEANALKAKLDAANKRTYGWNSAIKPYAYADGGLVNYTGPAWVDGTMSHPESFLSAEDTERIGNAAKLLSNIPALQSTSLGNQVSTNVGETNVEIHLNIDGISSDYDVDQMMNRIKQSLTDTISPIGSSVILNK